MLLTRVDLLLQARKLPLIAVGLLCPFTLTPQLPVMLSVVWMVNRSRSWYESGARMT